MVKKCRNRAKTSFGKVLIVDGGLTLDKAIEQCKEKSAAHLLSVNSKEKIDEVSKYLVECKSRQQGVGLVGRQYKYWHAGLSFKNGVGYWEDGSPYDSNKQKMLFKNKPDPHEECQQAVMFDQELYAHSCKDMEELDVGFFCVDGDGVVKAPSTTPQPLELSSASSSSLIHVLTVCGMIAAIIAFLGLAYKLSQRCKCPDETTTRESGNNKVEYKAGKVTDDGSANHNKDASTNRKDIKEVTL